MTSGQSSTSGKYYIGLMSGTSADGIDLALVDFSDEQAKPKLVASYYQAYSGEFAEKITALYVPGDNEIDHAFHLDVALAHLFAQAVTDFLTQEALNPSDIIAIGNHGQTIRHRPSGNNPYTLQIGCSQTLATLTSIRVVGQFRRKDMALGGQGAPLVPIFHQQLVPQKDSACFVVNIGGIANVTYLPKQGCSDTVLGFDTGPGNALLDDWFNQHHQGNTKFDENGAWAGAGQVNQALLSQFMQDDYIQAKAPKSTGREYYNLDWLTQQLSSINNDSDVSITPVDIQATLVAFTCKSIAQSIHALAQHGNVYVCGGGAHNTIVLEQLSEYLTTRFELNTMDALAIDGDQLEAMAFAWFAYAYDHNLVSNMPAVTGAKTTCTLGSLFLP